MSDDTNTTEKKVFHPTMVEVRDKDGNLIEKRVFDLTNENQTQGLVFGQTKYGE